MTHDEKINLGRIVAPHGIRGDLRFYPDTDRPELLKKLKRIFIGDTSYKLLSAKPHKNVYLLHVEGVNDRNTSETLVGRDVSVPAEELPKRTDGTYYRFQLLNLAVVDEAGAPVGTLSEIMETRANDVYTIKTQNGTEILVPAVPDYVLHVDLAKGTMTIKVPEYE